MIFLQILQTFYVLLLGILPLFIIALALSAIAQEYLPARTFEKLLQENKKFGILAASFFAALFPASSAYRIPIAALARRGGANWTPVMIFIAAGASAGVTTLIVTALISWQFAIMRLVLALIFSFILAIIVSKIIEPQFAAEAMDAEVEPLYNKDFVEASIDDIDKTGSNVKLVNVWLGFIAQVRIVMPWMLLSLFIAAMLDTVVPQAALQSFLGGRFALVRASLIGIPFYLIAGTDTPILYVFLKRGIDFGTVVTFMLAAPLLNFPVFLTMKKWIGAQRTIIFLVICWVVIMAIGFAIGKIGIG